MSKPIEVQLIGFGLFCWSLLMALLVFLFLFDPGQARALLAGLAAELVSGREGGIPVGLAAGAHGLFVWQGSFLQDLGSAFTGYPVFLYFLHRYHDRDWYLMRKLRRIEKTALGRKKYVGRWGPLGIGAFMLVPFMVNGPFVALVLGRLTGIPSRKLLPVVVVSTIITAALWTFFFDSMLNLVEGVDPRFGYWFAGVALVTVLMLGLVDFIKEHNEISEEEE
jgi:uncharacterized membrane protein